MKFIFLVFVLLSQSLPSYCQEYFKGKIIYVNKFQSKIPNVSDEQMTMIVGAKQDYFIKGGNYKSFSDGKSITSQQYDYKNNRLYNKTAQSDTLYWFDASINTDKVLSYEVVINNQNILGNDCDALILNTESGKIVFYYTSKYRLNVPLYKGHNYGNWFYFLTLSRSLPLKIVIENKQFKMESTATEIQSMELDNSFFEISPDIPLKKTN